MLDHAGPLGLLADDVAGGVLQVDDRLPQLAHALDEVRRLVRAGRIERAVVADEADADGRRCRMAAHRRRRRSRA